MIRRDDQGDRKGNEPGAPKFQFNNRIALFSLLILVAFFVFFFVYSDRNVSPEIEYSAFLEFLENGSVEEVTIIDNREIRITFTSRTGDIGIARTVIPYPDDELMSILRAKGIIVKGGSKTVSPLRVFLEFLPWGIGFLFIWFMFRQVQGSGNRAFSFGKSRAKRYLDTETKTTFSDVAGQHEAKYELREVVEFLKHPDKFAKLGARIPKGVLLVGMPGTGKTLLAKAIAGEADVPFFQTSGSDFVEMFVGVGASRVRDLFEQGRKHAPCILFIDELDAVGRTRGAGYGGGHDEREQTLNQILAEMDGFDTKTGVIIVAATNRPDVLDPALLRPGRFDRHVVVDMPDVKEREAILKIHAGVLTVGADVNFDRLARATPGSSGADLANLVNEAALYAARKNKDKVEMDDFEEARDKMIMGIARKSKIIPKKEKRMTAFHESGHALLHYYLENADPLHKVTIVPHGQAMGIAFSLPKDDVHAHSKGWLVDRITIALGGYAAEQVKFREVTTGAQNDIEQATSMARRMVCEWGMSEKLGPVTYGQKEEPIFLGKEIARHREYSEQTAEAIDSEIRGLIDSCLENARGILAERMGELDLLAQTLIERETLNDADIRKLLGLPEASEDSEEDSVEDSAEDSNEDTSSSGT